MKSTAEQSSFERRLAMDICSTVNLSVRLAPTKDAFLSLFNEAFENAL